MNPAETTTSKLELDTEKGCPPSWGKDQLSAFLGTAHQNAWATFHNMKAETDRLQLIDRLFRKGEECMTNVVDAWLPATLMFRSHAAFLGGCGLAMSGQLRECYLVLRGGLEDAIYAYRLNANPATQPIWLDRDKDEASRDRVRQVFHIGPMIDDLVKADKNVGTPIKVLYERTIDYGAHPNEKSVFSNFQLLKKTDAVHLNSLFLNCEKLPLSFALKTSAQMGIASLKTFTMIFAKRFELLRLTDDIELASHGL